MSANSITNTNLTAHNIRAARLGLNLTIEQAARRMGVGTRTWARYEAGDDIRRDKLPALLRTLGWKTLEGGTEDEPSDYDDEWQKANDHESPYWMPFFTRIGGDGFAALMSCGLLTLKNDIDEAVDYLRRQPHGTTIASTGGVFDVLDGMLPDRYADRYDYGFMFDLSIRLQKLLRNLRNAGGTLPVGKALLLRIAAEEGMWLFDIMPDRFAREYSTGYRQTAKDHPMQPLHDWLEGEWDDVDILRGHEVVIPDDDPKAFRNWFN